MRHTRVAATSHPHSNSRPHAVVSDPRCGRRAFYRYPNSRNFEIQVRGRLLPYSSNLKVGSSEVGIPRLSLSPKSYAGIITFTIMLPECGTCASTEYNYQPKDAFIHISSRIMRVHSPCLNKQHANPSRGSHTREITTECGRRAS